MHAKPFSPFKVRLADGSSHAVPNRGAAFVTRHWLGIGINPDRNQIPGALVRCPLRQITQIEAGQLL
jgi:hypothetical protein